MRILPLFFSFIFVAHNSLASVTIDFRNQGSLYDGKTSVDVDLNDPDGNIDFTMTVTSVGGNLNSNFDDFGIGSDAHIDYGEVLTVVFDIDVELINLDFGGVGSDANDGVKATIAAAEYIFHTGVTDYNGSTKAWTPATPILLLAGQQISLTTSQSVAGNDFNYEAMIVGAHQAPEPKAIIFLAMSTLALLTHRQRKQAA